MDQPIVIKDVLNSDLFVSINNILHEHCRWSLNNKNYEGSSLNWGVHPNTYELSFVKASTIIKLKILKHIRKNIKLCKIHCNGQTSNQTSSFHTDVDGDDSDVWTFVLFTECDWNTQWGGEFVSQHPKTNEYFYTPYIPNTGVLIPANWEHCGHPPFSCTDNVRTTIAFSYMELNLYYEKLKDPHIDSRYRYWRYL